MVGRGLAGTRKRGETLLASRIRSPGGAHWLAFFGGLLLCWAVLFAMAVPSEWRALEATYGASFLEMLCGGAVAASDAGTVFAMWSLMSAAMMAPTALPALATYDDLSCVAETGFGRLIAGYLAAWAGFSALAALAQVGLYRFGLVGGFGQSLSAPLTMALLVGAGFYQFGALKEACLSRCRAPLAFFLQHWEEGPFRSGLRLGLDCIGCCWALMALAFVGGTMNLSFMGVAMVLMTLEKLPRIGRLVTRPLGGMLIAAGLAVPFI
jgi:predicted metal-binding membrane protein